jgi:hypothetical protein
LEGKAIAAGLTRPNPLFRVCPSIETAVPKIYIAQFSQEMSPGRDSPACPWFCRFMGDWMVVDQTGAKGNRRGTTGFGRGKCFVPE